VSQRALLKLAAVAEATSGILNLIFFALHPSQGEPPPAVNIGSAYAGLHAVDMASLVLAVFGLTGLYVAQRREVGLVGFAGYIGAVVGSVLLVGFLWGDGFYGPLLAERAPEVLNAPGILYSGAILIGSGVAALIFLVGNVLFGVATIRAGVFSRIAATLTIVGAVIVALPPPPLAPLPWLLLVLGALILAVGLGWLSYQLWFRAELAGA
jgi:hypothetical protein